MSTLAVVLLVIIVAIAVLAVVWAVAQRRRSEDLRERFGPEYDRIIRTVGDRRQGESELEARRKRVEQLEIRPLSADDQARFSEEWRAIQARFVDDPVASTRDADRLIGELMQTRGYPVGDFEQRVADISLDHPNVVTNYRAAHRIAMASDEGRASTEDLRKGIVHYRELFDELLDLPASKTVTEEEYRAAS